VKRRFRQKIRVDQHDDDIIDACGALNDSTMIEMMWNCVESIWHGQQLNDE
jgi:hypothetical protein